MLCPDCRTKVPEKYTYCPKCGASLTLYRMDRHSVKRIVPAVCSVLAVGGLSTVAVISGIRTRNAIPQTAAEKPVAEAAVPEESAAPAAEPETASAPEPAVSFGAEDSLPQFDGAVHVDNIASLGKISGRHSGDVNNDGAVDVIDAQLILTDYSERLSGQGGILNGEQRANGVVTNDSDVPSIEDAQTILQYYAACVSDPSVREISVQEWCGRQETI
ncbi:MAG: zinc-ribbon domain-containing protein [Oscillospiraceae bacterium]|jgi:hypothetical protein|nr:zinc-ribbon domain-containing protein [Oscillospiraceae bacterium]